MNHENRDSMTRDTAEVDVFDWSARLGLVVTMISAGSLYFEKPLLTVDLAALGIVLSFLYLWQQLRLRATGRDYQYGGLFVSCLLPLAAIIGCAYCVLAAIHFVH